MRSAGIVRVMLAAHLRPVDLEPRPADFELIVQSYPEHIRVRCPHYFDRGDESTHAHGSTK